MSFEILLAFGLRFFKLGDSRRGKPMKQWRRVKMAFFVTLAFSCSLPVVSLSFPRPTPLVYMRQKLRIIPNAVSRYVAARDSTSSAVGG